MIWIWLLILCFAVLLFICAPLYGAPPERVNDELSDYRAALEEISDEAERRHFERQIITTARPSKAHTQRATTGAPSRRLTLGVFAFILLLTPLMYFGFGAPDLTSKAETPALLPTAIAEAAPEFEKLSPQARAERIEAMVDGLSARLAETPQDAQGWLRLLRARKVLSQEAKAREEIMRMKEALKSEEQLIAEIISQSGWDVE